MAKCSEFCFDKVMYFAAWVALGLILCNEAFG